MTDKTPDRPKRRSSQKRRRNNNIGSRLADDELILARERASRFGLSMCALVRESVLGRLGDPDPRSQRRPSVERELLLKTLGLLGRLRHQVDQFARSIPTADFHSLPELRQLGTDYIPIRDTIFAALGKAPSPALRDWEEFVAQARKAFESDPTAETVTVSATLLRRVVGAAVTSGKK